MDPNAMLPPELERTYQLYLVYGPNAKKNIQKLREIKAANIGSLVNVKGIVTKASDVKPCI